MPPAERSARSVVVLMPAGAAEPVLLARALASVLAQELEDWHLVLRRDGGDPDAVDLLLRRHDTGLAGRVTLLPDGEPFEPEASLAAALAAAPAGLGFVAIHDLATTWDPAFLHRTVSALSDPAHRDRAAALAGWTEVREHLAGGELREEAREPAPFDPRDGELEAALSATRVPAGALLLRAEAVDPAFLAAIPAGRLDHALVRRLLSRGDLVRLPELLSARHRRSDPAGSGAPPGGENGIPDPAGELSARNAALRALAERDPVLLELVAASNRADGRAAERDAAARASLSQLLLNVDRNGAWGHHRHEDLQQRLIRVEDALNRIAARLDAPHGDAPPPPPPGRRVRSFAGRIARRLLPHRRPPD